MTLVGVASVDVAPFEKVHEYWRLAEGLDRFDIETGCPMQMVSAVKDAIGLGCTIKGIDVVSKHPVWFIPLYLIR